MTSILSHLLKKNKIGLFIILTLTILLPIPSFSNSHLTPLTITLDSAINPTHAPLIIAKAKGFFAEEGLDVRFISPTHEHDAIKLTAKGKTDIGITHQPEFLIQIDQKLPLLRFGSLIDKPLNCFVALKENGINALIDLKGKQIGYSNDQLTHAELKILLAQQGLTAKDITLVKIQKNLTQALLTKKVDVIAGLMRNFEIPQLEHTGKKFTVFFPEEHGIPSYNELIFIIHKNNINDNRLPRFLLAVKKAVAFLDQHPNEAWQQFIAIYPKENNINNHGMWFNTLAYFAEDPAYLNSKEWENFAKFMRQQHLIKKVYPVSHYAAVIQTRITTI